MFRGLRNFTYGNRLKLLNLPSLDFRRLHNDLVWCYHLRLSLVLLYLNSMTFLSGALPDRTSSHRFKQLYFSQSVLLMYGTNCPSLQILVHYRYLREMCMALIYISSCFCKSSIGLCFVYLLGNFQCILCLVVQSFDKWKWLSELSFKVYFL